MSKGSVTYIGKLRSDFNVIRKFSNAILYGLVVQLCSFLNRSNFLGTKFMIYDSQPPHAGAIVSKTRSSRLVGLKQISPRVPAGNYPVAQISYELNVLGSR